MFGFQQALAGKPGKESTQLALQNNMEKLQELKRNIEGLVSQEELVRKHEQILAVYSQCAILSDETGDTVQTYNILRQGHAWQMIAQSAGANNATIDKQFAALKTRLLFSDGPGLMSVLNSEGVAVGEKYMLVDMLETIVEQETSVGVWPQAMQSSPVIQDSVKARLEAISAQIDEAARNLPQKQADNRRQAVRNFLELRAMKSEILCDAGFPVEAYNLISKANKFEVQEFGPAMGESSVTPYTMGKISMGIVEGNGDNLLKVLHSKDIPLTVKKERFLFNLRDNVRLQHKYLEKKKWRDRELKKKREMESEMLSSSEATRKNI